MPLVLTQTFSLDFANAVYKKFQLSVELLLSAVTQIQNSLQTCTHLHLSTRGLSIESYLLPRDMKYVLDSVSLLAAMFT